MKTLASIPTTPTSKKPDPVPNTTNNTLNNYSNQFKISIRLDSNTVTSVSLRKNIVSLWFILCGCCDDKFMKKAMDSLIVGEGFKGLNPTLYFALLNPNTVKSCIQDFVFKCIKKFQKDEDKSKTGLSEYIMNKMVMDILDESLEEDPAGGTLFSAYEGIYSILG